MDRLKSVIRFIRTKLPIICVVIFGLCWLAYFINSGLHKGGIDNQPRSFWNTIKVISYIVFINAFVFIGSFSAFMLIKPLPERYKVPRFLLRLVIAAAVSVFFYGSSYISMGAFVGFGG